MASIATALTINYLFLPPCSYPLVPTPCRRGPHLSPVAASGPSLVNHPPVPCSQALAGTALERELKLSCNKVTFLLARG